MWPVVIGAAIAAGGLLAGWAMTRRRGPDAAFRAYFEAHAAPMLLIDPASTVLVDVNRAASALYGAPREALRGRSVLELNALAVAEQRGALARARTGAQSEFHAPHRMADGSLRQLLIRTGPVVLDGRPLLCTILTDESESRALEEALLRRERLALLLAEACRAIARAKGRDELLHATSATIVSMLGLRFAWVGLVDAVGRVVPVARAGDDHGYVDEVRIETERRPELSRGPTGQALRSGRHWVSNDFLADEATKPWHALAERAGVRASAAFALHGGDHPVGTLNLYAGTTGAFDESVVACLDQLVQDLSLALERHPASPTAGASPKG